MATNGDRMNIFQRFKNMIGAVLGEIFYNNILESEIEVSVPSKCVAQFKGSQGTLGWSVLHFHKLESLPRLSRRCSQNHTNRKDVTGILNLRERSATGVFGSMAHNPYSCQTSIKKTLLEVFQSMPDTTFIWKYEEEDSKLVAHLKNVHLSSWVPQKALLGKYLKLPINRHTGEITLSADPRLSVFVTHGGLGSTTELAHMGKPALLIPLFSDQTRNAHMLVRHGGGIVLNKNDLENAGKVTASLKSILSDASYAQNAKRLAAMLLNQPISAKQLFIRHSEFAGRFGRLPNLDPYGRQLSFFQYYLIDLLLVVVTVFTVSIFVVVHACRIFLLCQV
ncbi:glycosyltransferase family 28 protein [Cooperia oncophora]